MAGWDTGQQIVKETLPALAAFRGIGASDAVGEFEHGQHRDSDSFIASFQRHRLQELTGILALAFGGDGGRRVEYQSQAGGSRGSR